MSEEHEVQRRKIQRLHTLGPRGTNCERAARVWLQRHHLNDDVSLAPTIPEALAEMPRGGDDALLCCAAYPDFHHLTFLHHEWLEIVDSFVIDTDHMVLAARNLVTLKSVASHPAPVDLIPGNPLIIDANSNAHAAELCSSGAADGAITTLLAARRCELQVVRDFGPVPMAFTIHAPRADDAN